MVQHIFRTKGMAGCWKASAVPFLCPIYNLIKYQKQT